MNLTLIAGTGHRPDKLVKPHLPKYSEQQFDRLTNLAEAVIKDTSPQYVMSGMALGWDMALAAAARHLGVPLIAAVPFEGQDHQWQKPWRVKYEQLLEAAQEVRVTAPNVKPGSSYSDIVQALHRRNTDMLTALEAVAPNSLLVALYNGDPKGGTAHAIKAAEKRGLPIRNYWGSWLRYA